ncbi:MAG: type I DNA topoisomerase [Pseudomonadota bacterium]
MSGNHLVIVESPAKAKTINKYLGKDYTVLASYGHVRDLPPKDGSVRPDENFAMDWELGARSKKTIDQLASAARDADTVYLATDPDREGEAISWHVQEVLKGKRGLKDLAFERVTFNEITKNAVLDAIARPRALDNALIQAYLARRALDYLVGFTLSPVLWRKLPGSRSAGRVQSVALRLICEREAEIEDFQPREYWTIEATLTTPSGQDFTARLTHLNGKKLGKFDLPDEATAKQAVDILRQLDLSVLSVEKKQVRRHPSPPFTTSTLQQEASRKLGMGASQTMRTAQRLYEGVDLSGDTVGLITYMRTDGTQLAGEAIAQTRSAIGAAYGADYVPDRPRAYKSTAKNAQEAHEAIRPTDPARHPKQVAGALSRDELRLYELIWKRTMACQMESAVLDQVSVDIGDGDNRAVLRATGSIVRFDGFLRVYEEGRDDVQDATADKRDTRLPAMAEHDRLQSRDVKPDQHFTQPPPRYSEASLVKRMEELGIGRPSTYASILQVLQDRDYVRLDSKRFVPEDRGRLVTTFLTSFFGRYVEYDFTAKLEGQLDDISGGRADWQAVLRDFWQAFSAAIDGTKDLTITQVIDALDEELGPHFFRPTADGQDSRKCPSCADGRLGLKLSRTGAFIGCSNYPDCRYTRPLEVPGADGVDGAVSFPRVLGADPESGLPVSVRKGPFGYYGQLGPAEDAEDKPKEKPKRVSLPKGYEPATVDLETVLKLLGLPRTVGTHPESGKPILAGIGRYGPYLQHDGAYKSLPAGDDVLAVGMNRAVELIATARKGGGGSTPVRELGVPDGDSQPVAVFNGRYGPYVRQGKAKIMASLPKGTSVDEVTLEQAVELLAAKAAKSGKGKAPKKAKKTAKSKASAKKARKPAAGGAAQAADAD